MTAIAEDRKRLGRHMKYPTLETNTREYADELFKGIEGKRKKLGKRLAKARKEARISQGNAGVSLNCSRVTIHNIEHGLRLNFDVLMLVKMCILYGVDVRGLIEECVL